MIDPMSQCLFSKCLAFAKMTHMPLLCHSKTCKLFRCFKRSLYYNTNGKYNDTCHINNREISRIRSSGVVFKAKSMFCFILFSLF